MITKTSGIVLGHIPYQETSIIARLYTRDYGYQSYIVNSVRSKKTRQGIGFFQPFNILEIVLYYKSSRDIQRISEFRSKGSGGHQDISKQAVLLFLAEVLNKILRNEETENIQLYDFLEKSFFMFSEDYSMPDFHIQLLLKLTRFLGLASVSGRAIFDNMNKVSDQAEIETLLEKYLLSDFTTTLKTTGVQRTKCLELIIEYLQHHVDGLGKIHSLEVLSQVFR